MKRSHWMTAAVFALALFAPTAWAAPGDKSPLSWVPATAPVVIHANSPETLRDHVVAFLKNAVPDQADRVQQHLDAFLKEGADGRKLRGLAKDGPIFVALLELPPANGPMNPPKAAFIAAVSNYAEFRDNILTADEKKNLKTSDTFEAVQVGPMQLYFVDKKDYVVVTTDMSVAAAYAKKGAGAEGEAGLDGKLSKEQAARFLAGDLGLYVDMEAVNKTYAEQIKAAHKAVDDQLEQMESALGAAQKAQFEMVKKIIGPLFQAVEDMKSGLAVVDIRPDGVSYHEEVAIRSGTPTADLLKASRTSAFAELSKMPAGKVFYTGMELDPTLLKLAGSLLTGLAANPDAKGAKEFTAAFDDWIKAGPSESFGAVTYPIAGVSVLKCTDPEKAVAALIKMIETMGNEGGFLNVYFKDKPEVKPSAEKYGEFSFTSVHMVWDLEKTMSAGGAASLPDALKKQMVEGMKKLMGEEMNSWIGTDGKAVVTVMAKDWESAKKTLDQYTKGQGAVGDDKAFAAVRKGLPEQASVVIVVDVVQYAGDLLDFITPIFQASGAPGLPAKFPKPVKDKPGFAGFAVTLHPDGAALDVVVPAETVKLVYESYVSPLLPKD